jgi:hypothetical protein
MPRETVPKKLRTLLLQNWRGTMARHQVPDQRNQKQNQEDNEQDLGDGHGASGDTAEAERRRDDGYDEKSDCPTEHDLSP